MPPRKGRCGQTTAKPQQISDPSQKGIPLTNHGISWQGGMTGLTLSRSPTLPPSLPPSPSLLMSTGGLCSIATTDALDHVQMLCFSQRDPCPTSAIHFSLPAACFLPDSHSRQSSVRASRPLHVCPLRAHSSITLWS